MSVVTAFFEQQPLMAMFLTIAIGYVAGEINVKGFSLGVGAVLFVALAMGWLAPASAPAPMVGTLGLALFLYPVGIQYGRQFFVGLTSPKGLQANLIALTLGVSLLLAPLHVRFHDVGYLWGVVVQIGFWLTPVIYQETVVPDGWRWLLKYNPMARIIEHSRQVVILGQWPDWAAA